MEEKKSGKKQTITFRDTNIAADSASQLLDNGFCVAQFPLLSAY